MEEHRHPSEDALRVVLAEYEHVRHMLNSRVTITYGSQLAVLTSIGITAVVAITSFGDTSEVMSAVLYAGIGGALLALGILIFRATIREKRRQDRYHVCLTALRTFLVRYAPESAPYLLLPNFDEARLSGLEPMPGVPVRLAGVFNSVLAGVLIGSVTWAVDLSPAVAFAGCLLAVVITGLAHLVHWRRTLARNQRDIARLLASRGWTGDTSPGAPNESPFPGAGRDWATAPPPD
jgi:hypothetical protein